MNKKSVFAVLLVLVVAILSGCATDAMNRQISIPSASDIQKTREINLITTSFCRLNSRLLIAEGIDGEWDLVGVTPDKKIIEGFVFVESTTQWGTIGMPVVFAPKNIASDSKFVLLSRDKKEAYDLWGRTLPKYEGSEFVGKHGTSLKELDALWTGFFRMNFRSFSESFIDEMSLQQYDAFTREKFKNPMTTPSGTRLTNLSKKDFEVMAAKNPKTNVFERFIKHFALSPAVLADFGLTAVANATLQTSLDRTPEGQVGSALQQGWSVADRFEPVVDTLSSQLLKQRKEIIFHARELMIRNGVDTKKADEIVDRLFQAH